MRAITLTMSAFGPYKEKQTIDFTQLGDESLFLITGPTGAGKTTIFDAMCFALYGKASGDDRDHDTLRSHFASVDDHTEVSFQFSLHQKVFEIVRSPKQEKRKARGDGYTEQPPQAELYEIIHGEKHLLYAKVKEVNEAIEDMLQLDYEQFRKMVMIPQGEFRRLISENSKEREEILQKIFRTYFYERVTKQLADESKKLQQQLERLTNQEEQEIKAIQWPEDYDIEVADTKQARKDLQLYITREIEEMKKQEDAHHVKKQALNKLQDQYYLAKELQNQFSEHDQLKEKLEQLATKQEEINIDKKKLQKAKDADRVEGYEIQVNQRKQEFNGLQQAGKDKEENLQKVLVYFEEVEKKFHTAKEEEQERESLKESVRKMKEEHEKLKIYVELKRQENVLATSHNEQVTSLKQLEQKGQETEQQLEKMEKETEGIQQITEQFYELSAREKEFEQLLKKGAQLKQENTKLVRFRQLFKQIKEKYDTALEAEKAQKLELQQLEQSQRHEQAAVLAKTLIEGDACPVCGSSHHPYKAQFGRETVTDKQLEEKRQHVEAYEKNAEELQKQYVDITSDGRSQGKTVKHLEEELTDLTNTSLHADNIELKMSEWKQEYESISKMKQQMEDQLKQLRKKQEDQKTWKQHVVELRKQVQEKYTELQSLNEKLIKVQSQLEQMGGEIQDPSIDVHVFAEKITEKEKEYRDKIENWNNLQQQFEKAKDQKNSLQVEVQSIKEQLIKAEEILNQVKKEFNREVEAKGFSSVAEYEQSKMEEQLQSELEQSVKTFEEHLHVTKSRYEFLTKELQSKERPEVKNIEEEIKQRNEQLSADAKAIQQKQIKIDRHETIAGRLDVIMDEKKVLEQSYFDIGELAKLARGDNQLRLSFERYVLSSFLDEILFQANIRLDQMTDHRYQLVRSDQIAKRGAQSGLDLEVIDFYTGQQRSVKTLSGGEGFKAALSLALGMADVVQAHSGGVELDTLFIDEGFGTLDEVSLEQALHCLSDLQKGNRMLGVISHVPKLKEEIRAKLNIETSSAGSKVRISIS
ncbi:exonuclease SbcC [Salirhabdus euzebyi]|uniref:Nuclease SbcCD subunit C n=1 Tax=Salirhabdus euzebyi TaxID=394506 RepID=A0A841PYU4_9BACI|nr:AAA family ATPase [Salirhabdus euzebyi]MBB6452281.1 exonuclease SbcC [Salirhabdus euzebyi]